jgi:hypothetical protein
MNPNYQRDKAQADALLSALSEPVASTTMMNEKGCHESQASAYNAAHDMIAVSKQLNHPLTGVYVCRRKTGDYICWPIHPKSLPPKSYKIVDEVFI